MPGTGYILDWLKSLFRCFHWTSWKNLNELFGQLDTTAHMAEVMPASRSPRDDRARCRDGGLGDSSGRRVREAGWPRPVPVPGAGRGGGERVSGKRDDVGRSLGNTQRDPSVPSALCGWNGEQDVEMGLVLCASGLGLRWYQGASGGAVCRPLHEGWFALDVRGAPPGSCGPRGGGAIWAETRMCLVAQLCPTLCDPMDCSLPSSSVCGDSPGKNTRVGCHALLQGIFPT